MVTAPHSDVNAVGTILEAPEDRMQRRRRSRRNPEVMPAVAHQIERCKGGPWPSQLADTSRPAIS